MNVIEEVKIGALTYVENAKKGLPKFKNIHELILGHLDLPSLNNFALTSRDGKRFARYEISKVVDMTRFGLKNDKMESLENIIRYFGKENCRGVKSLDLSGIKNINNKAIFKIKKIFPKVNLLILSDTEIGKTFIGDDFLKENLLQNLEYVKFSNDHITYELFARKGEEKEYKLAIHDIEAFRSLDSHIGKKNCSLVTHVELPWGIDESSIPLLREAFPNLISLDLSDCDISDKTAQKLDGFEKLKYLFLSGNRKIATLNFVKKLKNLLSLDVSSCTGIMSLGGVGELKKLLYFNASFCEQINSFEVLSDLPDLAILNLSNSNKDVNFDFVKNCRKMSFLVLKKCKGIMNFDFIKGLKLSHLNLAGSFVSIDQMREIKNMGIQELVEFEQK